MSEHKTKAPDESRESADERRSRDSAREVTEWETEFAAAKERNVEQRVDADSANAGAMVSRAHRAEKTNVRPPKP